MDESLWPTRNVAEYKYCPRLFYLMQIEGLHVASSDTEKGIAVHRRVDKPGQTPAESAEALTDLDRPQVMRSLVLSSEELGLTATLDLAEIDGHVAVPVEYRKGRPMYRQITGPIDDFEESLAQTDIAELGQSIASRSVFRLFFSRTLATRSARQSSTMRRRNGA